MTFRAPHGSKHTVSLTLRRIAGRVAEPVEHFMKTQAAGGLMLLWAAAAALLWANLWPSSYSHFWHQEISIGIGLAQFGYEPISMGLSHWVNDFFMTFFFMLAGFEIKREMADGELSNLRRASLPIAAAIGGMAAPALIYSFINPSGPSAGGWGIPMATDIAFAVGLLALLGDRVPNALRILLLALAIIDDLGAILVIAIFYSSQIGTDGLILAASGCFLLFLLRTNQVRPGVIYVLPLLVIWQGLYWANIHPTLAGVIVGMSAPSKPFISAKAFIAIARKALEKFASLDAADRKDHHHEAELAKSLQGVSAAGREAVSPVVRLEQSLQPWVAFLIMPVFAVANAGVYLGNISFDFEGSTTVFFGVAAGLCVGKPLGVLLVTYIATKLKLCDLPVGLDMKAVLVVGLLAGIGFTMSIFIGNLAFFDPSQKDLLEVSKLAILVGSAVSGILGLLLGRFAMSKGPGVDVSLGLAERSDDY